MLELDLTSTLFQRLLQVVSYSCAPPLLMSCRRDLIDGTECSAMRAERKEKRLEREPNWAGPRLHCECENGHKWHENFGGDLEFLTDCDCDPKPPR
jgi:hypothetical protein